MERRGIGRGKNNLASPIHQDTFKAPLKSATPAHIWQWLLSPNDCILHVKGAYVMYKPY